MKFHFGYFLRMAALTSDSVGVFELTVTEVVVIAFGFLPVDEYFTFT